MPPALVTMATLIRIKRSLTNEPAESIVVTPKTKRQRLDGTAEECAAKEHEATRSPSVLQRVGTVPHKDADLHSDILNAIQNFHQNGKDLRRTYKMPSVREKVDREANRQQALARASQSRYKLHAHHRGNIESVTTEKESEGAEDEGKPVDVENKKDREDLKKLATNLESDGFKYYDVEVPWLKVPDNDVITCNGLPLESEKYVYDIYYSPQAVDWTEYVCEVEIYDNTNDSSSDEPDDEDDENDESNWRNDYPEEDDDDSFEYDYVDRMLQYRTNNYDSDDSFDVDEYDETADFDEDGNLLTYGETNAFKSFHLQMSRMKMDSEDEEESVDEDINVDT